SLGRWAWPVIGFVLVYTVVVMLVLSLPAPFHGSDKVLGYGLALAALWYFGGLLWRLKKGTAGVKPVEDLVQGRPPSGWLLRRSHRIDPADLAEPCEVAVVRAHLKTVFDGERGEVSIADDVAPELVPGDEVGHDPCVSRSFSRDPGDLGFQPVCDKAGGLLRREGSRRGSFMSADLEERDERRPGKGHPPVTVKTFGQPVAGPLVEGAGLVDG